MNELLKGITGRDIKPDLEEFKNDYEKSEYLLKLLINQSTVDGPAYDDHYMTLRRYFISKSEIETFLPNFIRQNRDLEQFWDFIKNKYGTYAERRRFLRDELNPLLDYFEVKVDIPHTNSISNNLKTFGSEHIIIDWEKALERKENDPEGAITMSRTLIESVLKHILEELNVAYSNNSDLHEIYKLVAKNLNLAPEQHDVKVFKQILGGCSSIVTGLGSLRNKHGDAHGKGKVKYYKPSNHHAELAVNLAGSMCLFLIQTLQYSKEK